MSPRFIVYSLFVLSAGSLLASEPEFRGSMLPVLEVSPDKNTGLDNIYIVYNTSGVDMVYQSESGEEVNIYKYSNLGGGYAEKISAEQDGMEYIVKNVKGDLGYIIEDGDRRFYYWIVDYLPHRFDIRSVSESAEKDCDATILDIDADGGAIHYYTINGQQRTLDREIEVNFTTQQWDTQSGQFINIDGRKYYEYLGQQLRITPPAYCYTSFLISGDKFLRDWNWLSEAESSIISPTGIMVMTEAIQEGKNAAAKVAKVRRNSTRDSIEDSTQDSTIGNSGNGGNNSDNNTSNSGDKTPESAGSNEIPTGNDGLGGSAPAQISFIAYGTQGVLHNEWQLTKDVNFDDIEYRFPQREVDYTFTEEGTYYMRFVGSNSDGSCDAVGDVYTITIGASELKCPNAFSPDGDGVNDEWKVSYRSLLDFKCWIFDRFGNEIYYFDDPSGGWDGKRGSKLVAPGVYYYVIQATGADNKKYKKSGDINILRHRSQQSTSGSSATE